MLGEGGIACFLGLDDSRNSWYFSHDLLALGVYTQLALVLKKKQFEPKLVGAATPYLPVKYALTAPWMHWRLDRRVLTVRYWRSVQPWTCGVMTASVLKAILGLRLSWSPLLVLVVLTWGWR